SSPSSLTHTLINCNNFQTCASTFSRLHVKHLGDIAKSCDNDHHHNYQIDYQSVHSALCLKPVVVVLVDSCLSSPIISPSFLLLFYWY
ncbi:hypothetical protein TYRP_000812, partial [Tyrophagus putrescentiae]